MERTKWWTSYVLLLVLPCEDVAVNSNMKYIELDVIHSLLCLKEMLKTLKVYACIGICILKIFIVFLTNVFKYSKTSVFFSSNYGFCQPWCQKISMVPRIISISHLKKTDGWIHMVYIYFFIGTYIANSFIKFTNALMSLLLFYILLLSLKFIRLSTLT